MSRGILIAGNWKMNHGPRETERFFTELKTRVAPTEIQSLKSGKLRACIIPPTVSLTTARRMASEMPFPITIAAQNAFGAEKGAFTGETSGPMLAEIDIHWVLLGHSERRQYFGETDESVRKRAEGLLAQGFKLIVCIGETRAEREQNLTAQVLTRQLDGAISELVAKHLNGTVVLAYEPVWAIGTGLNATPAQAQESHALIRAHLTQRFGAAAAQATPILYGGSVTPENANALLASDDVDGALVGGASLKPESFVNLLAAGTKITR